MDFKLQLYELLGEASVKEQELLSNHTTLRIGGPADFLVTPASVDQVKKCIQLCKEEQIPYFILGKGSNLLVSDQGFRGVVIKLGTKISEITIASEEQVIQTGEGEKKGILVEAMAGVSLAKLANALAEEGLTGFECESGIPGTLGGAVVMNAGVLRGANSRSIALFIIALQCISSSAKRRSCISRAATTRLRTSSLDSSTLSADISEMVTGTTSTWMSIRSIRGPDMRDI